jgi:DNA-binding MarR family transcriptional regulator
VHISNVLVAWALGAHDLLAEAAADIDLDLRSVAALTLVDSHDGATVDWLAPRVGLSQSATVRLVDRLESASWVDRRRVGREVALTSTAAGRRVLGRWQAHTDAVAESLTSELGPDELAELIRLLASTLARRARPRTLADRACRTCDWKACGNDCPVDRSVATALGD